MKNPLIVTVIIALVVGVVGFLGGVKYQQTKTINSTNGFIQGQGGQRNRNGRNMGRGANGGATLGEVVSVDNNSIVVKLADGSSKIVNVSNTTTFSKTDTASKTDIKTGDRIAVFGATASDGSVTAQNVQLNPMFRIGPGGPTPGQ